ncbi:MAG: hypothetical protein WCK31_00820 [bacterium]
MKDRKLIISLVIGGFIFVIVVAVGITGSFLTILSAPDISNTEVASNTVITSSATLPSSSSVSLSSISSISSSSYSSSKSSATATLKPIVSKSSATATPTPTSKYKSGKYTAQGPYFVEGHTETISVSLSIDGNGKINTSNVTGTSTNKTSRIYIQDFISQDSQTVVGKAIDQAYIYGGGVSGASETARGFDTALNSIISQAKN